MGNQPGKIKSTDKKGDNKPVKFLREVRAELKKVTWPDRQDVLAHTGIVIVVVILVAAFLGAADAVFAGLLNLIIN